MQEILTGEAHVNDAEIIHQARQGDETAWRALVHEHQTAIFRLAYLLLGDADAAEDVAQETFVRAYRYLDRFDSTRPLRPWLLQITRHQAANQRRSARRYLAALGRWWQVTASATHGDAAMALEPVTDADLLWQAVRALSTSDQEVIYLRHFLALSVNETAVALDIAEGTVKSRLARALTRLRAVIEQEYPSLREEVRL